ncbi:MAG: lysostaphin resistance A-like protein [Rubrobacter sp.]
MNGRTESYVGAARRGKDNWWRYLLGIVLVVFLWLGIGGMLSVALILAFSGADLQSLGENPFAFEAIGQIGSYVVVNAAFPVFLLGTVLATALIHRRHPRTLVTAGASISWGRVARGFGVWFTLVCAAGLLAFLVYPSSFSFRPDWATFAPFALLALILTPIQTTSEELFFRGYLVQAGARISRSPAFLVVAPSILFMLLHLGNPELSFATSTSGVFLSALYYFAFGAFLVWISLKDGTTELAIGAHAANNLFAVVLLTFKGSSLDTPALFYTDRGPDPTVNLVAFLVLAALFYLTIFKLSRRKPVREASSEVAAEPTGQGQPDKPRD